MRSIIVSPYFLPSLSAGGPVVSISNLLEGLGHDDDNNDKLELLTRRKLHDKSGIISKNEIDQIKEKFKFKLIYSQSLALDLFRIVFSKDVSRIYCNSFFDLSTILTVLFSRINRSPPDIIIAPRGELNTASLNFSRVKKKIWLYIFKHLFYSSRDFIFHFTSADEVSEAKKIISIRKFFLIPNLSFLKERMGTSFKSKSVGNLRLITYSRISPKKRLIEVANFVSQLRKSYPNITLDIFGFIEDHDYFDRLSFYFSEHINYKGVIKRDNLHLVLANYDMFISLSLNENFGHSAVESMILGLPVILSSGFPWCDIPNNAGVVLDEDELKCEVKDIAFKFEKFYLCDNFIHRRELIQAYIENKLNISRILSDYKNMLFDSE